MPAVRIDFRTGAVEDNLFGTVFFNPQGLREATNKEHILSTALCC